MSVIVVANIIPVKDSYETVLDMLTTAAPAMHALPGCEKWAVNRGRGAARGRLCLLEKWADDDALAAYGRSEELQQLHARLEELVESVDDYMVVGPVPGGDNEKGAI
jgi:quinol monooxygenase YgiN